jgi:FixJ family two-component response regulator
MDFLDNNRDFGNNDSTTVYLVCPLSTLAEYFASAILRMGCESLTYGSFDSFLAQCSATTPGCVVLTVDQVDSTATNYFSQIRALNKQAQVLVSPHRWRMQDVVFAIHSGFVDFLDAATDAGRLETALSAAIARDQALRCKSLGELPESILTRLDFDEAEIFRCIILGRTTKEISGELDISVRTVHYRKKSIFSKLGLRNRDEAFELIRNIRRDNRAPPAPHLAARPSFAKSGLVYSLGMADAL